jgi:hypothetical protein
MGQSVTRHCNGKKPETEASVPIAAKSVIMIAKQTEPNQRLTSGQIAPRALDISDLDVDVTLNPRNVRQIWLLLVLDFL